MNLQAKFDDSTKELFSHTIVLANQMLNHCCMLKAQYSCSQCLRMVCWALHIYSIPRSSKKPEPDSSPSPVLSLVSWVTLLSRRCLSLSKLRYSLSSLFSSLLQQEHDSVEFCWDWSIWHTSAITELLKGNWSVSSFQWTGRKQKLWAVIAKPLPLKKHITQ